MQKEEKKRKEELSSSSFHIFPYAERKDDGNRFRKRVREEKFQSWPIGISLIIVSYVMIQLRLGGVSARRRRPLLQLLPRICHRVFQVVAARTAAARGPSW